MGLELTSKTSERKTSFVAAGVYKPTQNPLRRPRAYNRDFTKVVSVQPNKSNCLNPQVRSFKLYPNYGEVTVSLRCQRSPLRVNNTKQELAIIREFHCFLFSQVLRVPVELKPESTDGYFIVLLTNSGRSVDLDLMKDELRLGTSLVHARQKTRGKASIEADSVVTKNYVVSRQKYAVLRVRDDLTPLSPFPDKSKGETYAHYFHRKYGERITNRNQPLIEVKEISGRVNFLVDRKPGTKNKRDVCLVPELCNQVPIRASLLSASQILPSVLQRVSSLLLVSDVKAMVAGERDSTDESVLPPIGADDGSDRPSKTVEVPMEFEGDDFDLEDEEESDSDKEINNDSDLDEEFPGLFSDIRSIFRYSSSSDDYPDSALVLQALTTTHSGDAFNLERLEMLGDAFLKLAVSLHLFCTYSDKDEGKLTRRKINQISNLALYRAAAKKSLGEYLQSTQLARDVWCPTGCQFGEVPQETSSTTAMEVDSETSGVNDVAMEEVDSLERGKERTVSATERARQKCNTQVITDKSVADSIEALIGAYLISCGYLGALRFLKFLGLKVLPEADTNDDSDLSANEAKPGSYNRFWPDPTTVTAAHGKEDMIFPLISGLEGFEQKSIKYNFEQKLYLVEALTHASYHANRVTPCYQRLEFLGDALLDFLVTQHLYFRHAKLSPGQLTDIRQALVNNNIFATIAVNHDYHKYLKQMSPQWFKTVENFINRVEDEAEERERNRPQTVRELYCILVYCVFR